MDSTTNSCKIQGCIRKGLISAIAVFIFIAAAEYLIHGVWLNSLYEQTATLWRSKEEMEQLCPWVFVVQAIMAILFTALYCKCQKAKAAKEENGKKTCPKQHGLCFGIIIGLLLGVMHASCYLWMPIPLELAVKWFIAGLVEGIGIGLVLSFTCHTKAEGKSS